MRGKAADGGRISVLAVFVPTILSLVAVFLAVIPALDAGFLADDFYIVEKISERAPEGLRTSVRDAFVHRWTVEFDIFRPLTILSLQLDFAFHGSDGRPYHATNIGLWLLCAALAGAVAARFPRTPAPAWIGILFFGLSGACAESVGWIVAREDLLLASSALLSLRLLLAAPERPLLWTLALVPGFLAKETAVVLPPLLLWTDLILRPGSGNGGGRTTPAVKRLRRHAGPFLLLAAYFGIRLFLFGRLGGTYGGRSYSDYLDRPDIVAHVLGAVAESAARVVAPVNHSAWMRLTGTSPLWAMAASAVLWATLLAIGLRRNGACVLRSALAGLPWIAGPLTLLVIPLEAVDRDLRLSRFLALPLAGWMLPALAAAARGGRPTRVAIALLAVLGFVLVRVNLDTYVKATECAEDLVTSITSAVPSGGRALILAADPPAGGPGLNVDLIWYEGAHLLSAGLFHATHPPFQSTPGITVEIVPRGGESEVLARQETRSLPTGVFRYTTGADGPRFRVLAHAGDSGFRPLRDPPPGATRSRQWEPRFRVFDALETPPFLYRTRLIVTDLDGQQAIADFRSADLADPAGGWTLDVPGSAFRLRSPEGEMIDHPLTAAILRDLREPVLLWWIEVDMPGRQIRRTPFSSIFLR